MTLEEIKDNVTMFEVANNYGVKIKNGNMCCCPFHGERNPSMKLFRDSFKCFSCNEHGDVVSFVQKMEKCDFKTAFTILGGTYEEDKETLKNALKRVEMARYERQVQKERERKANIEKCDEFRKIYRQIMADLACYRELYEEAIPGSDAFWEYLDKYHMALLKEQNLIGGENDFRISGI